MPYTMKGLTRYFQLTLVASTISILVGCGSDNTEEIPPPPDGSFTVGIFDPVTVQRDVAGSLIQRVNLELDIESEFANLSLYIDDKLAIDNIDVPSPGINHINALVDVGSTGVKNIKVMARGSDITVNKLEFAERPDILLPQFKDIAEESGIANQDALPKYGGPTVADINNNGYYDIILNNHNWRPTNQLYWNNQDGTFTVENGGWDGSLSWGDMHGTAAADYNHSGDLGIIVTRGGGNGTTPSYPDFFVNEQGKLTESYQEVGITESARGRGARFLDMNGNGYLDLVFINAEGINGGSGAQHLFYKNNQDGTFSRIDVPGIEKANTERALVLDFDGDGIDDLLFLTPMTLWKGNGDFIFTDVTDSVLPENVRQTWQVQAAADVDVTGNGLPDIYLSKGLPHYQLSNRSLDFNPIAQTLNLNDDGNKGRRTMQLTVEEGFTLKDLHLTYRQYDGGFPIMLGEQKIAHEVVKIEDYYTLPDDLDITPDQAKGWPSERDENGIYIGYIGDNTWNVEWVKNADVFWQVAFTMDDIKDVNVDWQPQNRNQQDVLLVNRDGRFVDETAEWNLPKGGNHWGVTYGDFNNSGHNDIFIHRYGYLKERVTDYLLINNGEGQFEITQMHGAHDVNDSGHGDMGQAFALTRDGKVDLLNGSEDGIWYLYKNQTQNVGNHSLVHVGYSPLHNIDPMSAVVTVKTESKSYTRRVGSAGENFSQSLLNTVHFGLGKNQTIEEVKVTWRNGEVVYLNNVMINERVSSDDADMPTPESISLGTDERKLRPGATYQITPSFTPLNANPLVTFQSSDPFVASVSDSGLVTALALGETEILVQSSVAEQVSASLLIRSGDFDPIYATDISIVNGTDPIYVGQTTKLSVDLMSSEPGESPDDTSVTWSSSDSATATVSVDGVVNALKAGSVQITASANGAQQPGTVTDSLNITIEDWFEASVMFDDDKKYMGPALCTNQPLSVAANYHAGSGSTVNGNGLTFRLRQMDASWGLVNDYIIPHLQSADTTSGSAAVVFDLTNPLVIPTADLPDGHFHFLFVEFVTDEGKKHERGIGWAPGDINIVECN
ncbi:FG-GAP-like repeat-containing protein [Vibrio vulnificus]|uniref:FG-GAP-like repeat-containing protein n=1 Tax=Vibrio vulnificus TaxID=672 RepID=UPI001F5E62B7|nr:FG-GAP-like repeat-containing protein [Vibrio vulnificus]MCU8154542.1 FG-GAP-like repeat-containing protein [Vibrio vulnificus]